MRSSTILRILSVFVCLSLVLKVDQVGGAACHEGYRTCFFRKVESGEVQVVGERVFDPQTVYKK